MLKNRKFVGFIAILSLILLSISLILVLNQINVSDVADADTITVEEEAQCLTDEGDVCLALPSITGLSINSLEVAFPDDFQVAYHLVVMPFDREQQEQAITWLPLFQELVAESEQVELWSIAALPELNAGIRLLVLGGLSAVISDADIRPQVTAIFLADQQAFLDELNIETPETIRVFIMDDAGVIYYTDQGIYTEESGIAFREAFQTIIAN